MMYMFPVKPKLPSQPLESGALKSLPRIIPAPVALRFTVEFAQTTSELGDAVMGAGILLFAFMTREVEVLQPVSSVIE
jgi:hypothetical protein